MWSRGSPRQYLVNSKLCWAFLGHSPFIALGNKAIGARHKLGGACCDIVSEQSLISSVFPFCQQDRVQQVVVADRGTDWHC